MVYEIPGRDGLTVRQNKFVDAWVTQGRPGNATQCAELAGYGKAGAAVRASELLRHPAVLQEIKRRGITTLTSEIMGSVNVMTALRDSEAVDPAVRLRAAQALLDRAIPIAHLHQVDINVTVEPTREETVRQILDLHRRRGEAPPPWLEQAMDFHAPDAFSSTRPPRKIIEHQEGETEISLEPVGSGAQR